MESDSLCKGAARSFFNTFFKVFGFAAALVVIIIGIGILLSGTPQRTTTTVMKPDHNWKVKIFSSSTPTILEIPITGVIGLELGMRKERIAAILQDIQELDLKPGMFKAIILTINTPGGSADDSEAILRMLTEFKKMYRIPVYAYIDGMSASGGTMISLAADKIISSPSSLIGHVGSIFGSHFFNFSKTLAQYGVEAKTIYAGKHKDELDPFRPWKEGEGNEFQNLADISYEQFIKLVVAHRPRITEDQLRDEGAQLYFPQQALEQGYIDQISDTFTQALGEIATTLEISNNYQVIELRPQIMLSELFGNESSFLAPRVITHTFRLPGDIDPELVGKPLYLYVPKEK